MGMCSEPVSKPQAAPLPKVDLGAGVIITANKQEVQQTVTAQPKIEQPVVAAKQQPSSTPPAPTIQVPVKDLSVTEPIKEPVAQVQIADNLVPATQTEEVQIKSNPAQAVAPIAEVIAIEIKKEEPVPEEQPWQPALQQSSSRASSDAGDEQQAQISSNYQSNSENVIIDNQSQETSQLQKPTQNTVIEVGKDVMLQKSSSAEQGIQNEQRNVPEQRNVAIPSSIEVMPTPVTEVVVQQEEQKSLAPQQQTVQATNIEEQKESYDSYTIDNNVVSAAAKVVVLEKEISQVPANANSNIDMITVEANDGVENLDEKRQSLTSGDGTANGGSSSNGYSSEQDAANCKQLAAEQINFNEQVMPKPESLIEYEEVLEQTPEEAAIDASLTQKMSDQNVDHHFEDQEDIELRGTPQIQDQEQISRLSSISSAEPQVAEELVQNISNIGSDNDCNVDDQDIDERDTNGLSTVGVDVNQFVVEKDGGDFAKADVKIEESNFIASSASATHFDLGSIDQFKQELIIDQIESVESINTIERANYDSRDSKSNLSQLSEALSEPVSEKLVNDELQKQGLSEVVYAENDENPGISSDYFLRLVNCQTQVAQKCQQVYIDQAVVRRREAFQAANWEQYANIVDEMGIQQQSKHEEVLTEVCRALGITEEEFTAKHDSIAESEQADQLQLALQGQLFDIFSLDSLDEEEESQKLELNLDAPMTEEKALEIFEVIKRLTLESQNKEMNVEEDEENEMQQELIQNSKIMDEIYIRFGMELKDFQGKIHSLIAANPNFEQRLIEKEAEIMDDSI